MIGEALGAVSDVFSIFGGNSKDPERLATNQDYYNRALTGDATALAWLKAHAYGTDASHDPVYGYWATTTARKDAEAKYLDVLARQKIGDVAATVSQVAGKVAVQSAATSLQVDPARAAAADQKVMTVIAVIGVALFLWFRRDA